MSDPNRLDRALARRPEYPPGGSPHHTEREPAAPRRPAERAEAAPAPRPPTRPPDMKDHDR